MPHLLELGMQVDRYNALPLSGGLWDQPAGLMRKITQVLNVYHAVKAYERDGKRAGEMAKWRSENEDTWAIISHVRNLRDNHG